MDKTFCEYIKFWFCLLVAYINIDKIYLRKKKSIENRIEN